MDHDTALALIERGVGGPGGVWADLGAGSGVFTRALSSLLGTSGTVYAIDRNPQALRQLSHSASFGATIHVQQADFTRRLELPALDGILLANSLHFVARQVPVLQRLLGYLTPGGRVLIVEYDTRQRTPWGPFPIDPARLLELSREVGLGEPQELGRMPSRFGSRELYAAVMVR